MNRARIYSFVRESNGIEGIERITEAEIAATERFLMLRDLSVERVVNLVQVYQPDAKLRVLHGMDVLVGNHVPPPGGPYIRASLESLLETVNHGVETPYRVHVRFETLHPFTDGNGRSGRAIWLWQMRDAPLGFLHQWYYQSLQAAR